MGRSVVVLPEPAAPFDDGYTPARRRDGPNRLDLFFAQRITRRQKPRHLVLDCLGGQGMSRIGGHSGRHVTDFKLHLEVVTG